MTPAAAPMCLVMGSGRMAGGFIAPLFADAGWSTTLVGRDRRITSLIERHGSVILRVAGSFGPDRRVDGIDAIALDDPRLASLVRRADLVATAVGPSALGTIGRLLGPLVRARLDDGGAPLNIVTFENHVRAPELLSADLLLAVPSLAREIGRRLGVAGAAVWRAIARREATPGGVRYDVDAVDECHVDAVALLSGIPPADGSVTGMQPSRAFEDRIVEKMWVFNAGHAAAAYLGWGRGFETLPAALADPTLRQAVAAVVDEARLAFRARVQRRPVRDELPARPLEEILARYADAALDDEVVRVAREPRRKLAPEDRLVGPAVDCQAAGVPPVALATAMASALRYAHPGDPQTADLQAELRLLGPEEVLANVSDLDPSDELSRLVVRHYRERGPVSVPAGP